MRAVTIVTRWLASFVLAAGIVGVANAAEDAVRYPVPATAIYPGDVIRDEMIMDRNFAPNIQGASAFINDRASLVGRIARRTLLAGHLIPINGLEDLKAVTRGAVVKVLVEDDGLIIVTYATSLQSGSAGMMVQLRNLDTGVTIRGIVQQDGSVRIQNG
ncbi:flagella basal body P-ring formation protein FlgA [Bradyrhizobium sp. NFR13]|jgi:flagella basal body P-ring formation protein FlgA|uniref:flagellar basal body P-ring formation chaperone FlgA n=1 Tax=Bradyrhizobium sp. NFR13 TaxID=1566285 RepID=UPI0008E74AB1|nr:flagellar basal body P-ring formation chaperone FlgA [Bradyrhizobium sp. NFR13]SFL44065.1 flagella basal body P-ring formation protein FlgA [Bradyrhizobium sp. NFR13]